MGEIIEWVSATYLAKVNDTGVATILMIDVGYVEVAMRQPCLRNIQPGIIMTESRVNSGQFLLAQPISAQQRQIALDIFERKLSVGRMFCTEHASITAVTLDPAESRDGNAVNEGQVTSCRLYDLSDVLASGNVSKRLTSNRCCYHDGTLE